MKMDRLRRFNINKTEVIRMMSESYTPVIREKSGVNEAKTTNAANIQRSAVSETKTSLTHSVVLYSSVRLTAIVRLLNALYEIIIILKNAYAKMNTRNGCSQIKIETRTSSPERYSIILVRCAHISATDGEQWPMSARMHRLYGCRFWGQAQTTNHNKIE